MKKDCRNLSRENVARVRALRTGMMRSEGVLWNALRKERLGFRFRRQHPIGPYALDFYCPEASLCVELDGDLHEGRVAQDKRRDEWLDAQGIRTLRFASDSAYVDLGTILYKIKAVCEERAGRPAVREEETSSVSLPFCAAKGREEEE